MTQQLTDQFLDDVTNEFEKYIRLFPAERAKFQILQEQLEQRDKNLCDRKNMKGHLTASGLLLNSAGDAVFLIYHNFLKLWLQPGGHLDPGERPAQGALREFVEETGIKNVVLHRWHEKNELPFDMDTHEIPVNERKGEGEHFHHDFQYLFRMSGDADNTPVIDLNEVSQYRWVSLDELIKDHDDRLKRVAAKIRAGL